MYSSSGTKYVVRNIVLHPPRVFCLLDLSWPPSGFRMWLNLTQLHHLSFLSYLLLPSIVIPFCTVLGLTHKPLMQYYNASPPCGTSVHHHFWEAILGHFRHMKKRSDWEISSNLPMDGFKILNFVPEVSAVVKNKEETAQICFFLPVLC